MYLMWLILPFSMFICLSLKATIIYPKTAYLSINYNPDPNSHPESLACLIKYIVFNIGSYWIYFGIKC